MEIIRRDDGEIEFYTIALTGQSGMSQSGLAILSGVSRQALIDLEKTLVSKAPSEYLQSFVGKDLTLVTPNPLINGKLVGNLKIYKSLYCAAVLKHYSREESPEHIRRVATFSILKFADRGITDWIQGITEWKQYKESILPHTSVYVSRIEHMRDHEIPDHLWAIFREGSELLLLLEKDWRVPINDYDILDGSIGRKWSDYRSTQPWIELVESYVHSYRDQRGKRPCNAYSLTELPHFRLWLRSSYVPEHLPKYLITKYGKQVVRQVYTEIGDLSNYILELTEVKRITPQEEKKYQDFLIARQKLRGFLE